MSSVRNVVSADDLALASTPPRAYSPERRARSASPTKQVLTFTDYYRSLNNGSADSIVSTASLSHDQLMQLSKSPISKTLHITKKSYGIPIPFQLQMPPRLSKSQPSSPTKAPPPKSPKKLIFTGNAYEPVDSEFESDLDMSDRSFSRISVKPPTVTASRKKIAKFVKKTHSVPLDQLSMIEEANSGPNSRQSSMKSKDLPELPLMPSTPQTPRNRDFASSDGLNYGKPRLMQRSTSGPLAAPVAKRVSSALFANEGIHSSAASPSTYVGASDLYSTESESMTESESESHSQSETSEESESLSETESELEAESTFEGTIPLSTENDRAHSKLQPELTVLQSDGHTETSHSPTAPVSNPLRFATPPRAEPLPHSFSYHPTLDIGRELKISKRTFSDESQVSSVSSFSSVGDVFNLNFMLSPNARGEVRISSNIANYLLKESLSRQQTIKLDIDEIQQKSASGRSTQASEGNHRDDQEAGLANITEDVSQSDLLEQTAGEQTIINDSKTVSIENDEIDGVDDRTIDVDDNHGAGVQFNFPNNSTNVTNSTVAKSRSHPLKLRKRNSALFLVSSDGQIEIPDLEDQNLQKQYAALARAGSTSTDATLEPIGVPGAAAKNHLKTMFGDSLPDSDSDSSFNSQFSKLNKSGNFDSTKKPDFSKNAMLSSRSQGAISSSSSPIRHARHRSMFNIDFNYLELNVSPERKHSRSKSDANIAGLGDQKEKATIQKELPTIPRETLKLEVSQELDEEGEEEPLKIVVAEPPKRVEYKVDFKSAGAEPQVDRYGSRHGFHHTNGSLTSTPSDYYTPLESEVSSGYQSSKTARETASTAPTDNNSVVIDLTKEDYNICMIKRNDSTTSYKSVIEKTRDGRRVEVVLVEEDEGHNDEEPDMSFDRDDLLSIYSRYMNDWIASTPPLTKQTGVGSGRLTTAALQLMKRNNSTRSSTSSASEASVNSWAASSESNFQVKSLATLRREQAYKSAVSLTVRKSVDVGMTEVPRLHHANKQLPRAPGKESSREASYFDYASNVNYDFKSFMKNKSSTQQM